MSARYGDRTRSGEPVANAGQRQSIAGGLDVYETEFLAPGTWTWPGNCNFVEVLIVGGGGAGKTGTPPSPTNDWTVAGGGGVGTFMVPVSAPVPVTVGAGGTAAPFPSPAPLSNGAPGGLSAFGPTSPPVPTVTVQVGGGMGAGTSTPFDPVFPITIRGGASAGNSNCAMGGRFGTPASEATSPTKAWAGGGGGALGMLGVHPDGYRIGVGTYGYGAGGYSSDFATTKGVTAAGYPAQLVFPFPVSSIAATAGIANTGQAGGSANNPPATPYPSVTMSGKAGGSGIVIVRWYE